MSTDPVARESSCWTLLLPLSRKRHRLQQLRRLFRSGGIEAMASSNGMAQPTIPTFSGTCYNRWSFRMKAFFEYHELLEVVERGVTPLHGHATESERQAFRKSEKMDQNALFFIHQGINNEMFELIAGAKTAKEAWSILETSYQPEGQWRPSFPSLYSPWSFIPERAIPYSIWKEGKTIADYLKLCVPMYRAAMNGNWKAAEALIKEDPNIIRTGITSNEETALHIATAAKHKHFVKKLVSHMNEVDLKLRNLDGNTALCLAAASGVLDIAKVMVAKSRALTLERGRRGLTPLHMAAMFQHRKTVLYLYKETELKSLDPKEHLSLFHVIISAGVYDVALEMLQSDSSLATSQGEGDVTALHLMARKPSAIASESQLGPLKGFINSCCKRISHDASMPILAHHLVEKLWEQVLKLQESEILAFVKTPSRLLFDAAASGNVEFLVIILRSYPDLIWKVDGHNRSLFHVAAINRQEGIFNLVYELGNMKDCIAYYKERGTGNNMLHLVASLPPPEKLQVVSGAALQMQVELHWFEAVKKIVPISYIKMENKRGELPQELFAEEHKELRKEGEKWMKNTAASCMLVATLIATVVFSAAFTVPGGNDNDSGIPIFQRDKLFNIFVLSDTVALSTSSFSIVIFLSILTSGYAEADFHVSLPRRLMFGLFALFFSIITMIIAFSSSVILIYNKNKFSWAPILTISLGGFTVLSFVLLHGRVCYDTIRSTLWRTFLFQPRRRRLFR